MEDTTRKRVKSSYKTENKLISLDTDDDSAISADDVKVETSSFVVPKETTREKVMQRVITGFLLAFGFLAILFSGHLYCIILAFVIQTELYRELVNVRYQEAKLKRIPYFRTVQWGWFLVPMFYVYGETLHRFCTEHKSLAKLTLVTVHYHNISFVLYCILFMVSVLTLKQGFVKYQLSQLMWSIATVCLVVLQCKFLASTILSGLFWLLFPLTTVAMNDIFAYIFGMSFGRKIFKIPFMAMSPNKTWEGFLGAAICTIIFSFFFPVWLSRYQFFACPADTLTLLPFMASPQCDINPIFVPVVQHLPYFGNVLIAPIQWHGLAYGLFASIVAPFGGFLASAIKRAYHIKDFDSFLPGHGGVMDRMDCQIFMLGFTAFHYRSFVASRVPSVDKMIYLASLMTLDNQLKLVKELQNQISSVTSQ